MDSERSKDVPEDNENVSDEDSWDEAPELITAAADLGGQTEDDDNDSDARSDGGGSCTWSTTNWIRSQESDSWSTCTNWTPSPESDAEQEDIIANY